MRKIVFVFIIGCSVYASTEEGLSPMIIKLTIGLILGISTADAKFAYLLQDD
jgi:hypothetical protein